MSKYEQVPASEAADNAEITRCILRLQERHAAGGALQRGTHAQGTCVRAILEVHDLSEMVDDAALASRLARGPFAVPGRYPAVVRFASASMRPRGENRPDVRSLSFSAMLPAPDGGEQRVDISLNSAPTIPMANAHDLAVLLRVMSADGVLGKTGTLLRLPPRDWWRLVRCGFGVLRQERRRRAPFQQLRYWSGVPFAHGADEVVKQSALPVRGNPASPLNGGATEMRDELVRHLTDDRRMASFDIALQFLDTERMTHRGRTYPATFWVEDASVEWNEEQAPFHRVARLTLLPASVLSAAEADAVYFDVWQHRFEECRPLGGVNRARRDAERHGRRARLSSDADAGSPPARGLPVVGGAIRIAKRAGAIPLGRVARVAVVAAGVVVFAVAALSLATMRHVQSGRTMLPAEVPDLVLYPDQGWGAGVDAPGRQTYYYTSQGAGLRGLRYSWFVHLELPWGRDRLADPAVMRRYGFIVDPATAANPDQLPVGFTRHFDRNLNEEVLSITCAACHSGEIHVTSGGRTTAVRIDGGQAMHAFTDASFGHFLPMLITSLASTATNPVKFDRFARRVLGANHPHGRAELHRELRAVIATFAGIAWNERNLYPTEEGYGRTDALARIANTVFGENMALSNLAVGNAPVSYPPVWNIWKFDWVQYNASVSQPMARNIGEAMGVGATYALVNRYGAPLPASERFRSSALLENLHTIETTLRELKPPAWNEEVMGRIDRQLAEQGRTLFNQHCVGCHGPHEASPELKAANAPLKGPDDPEWIMHVLCVDDIGTDPNAAMNFATAMVDIRRTGMTAADLRAVALLNLELQRQRQDRQIAEQEGVLAARLASLPASATDQRADVQAQLTAMQGRRFQLQNGIQQQLSALDPQRIPVGAALSYLGTMIREQAYRDMGVSGARRDTLDGFGALDLPQVVAAYKARPLAGMWATAPFLHNGSVPTIYDLLSPVAERPRTFAMGSREFDPVRLGLKQPTSGRWFTFDTSLSGNHNTGHEFGPGYVPWTPGSPPQGGLIGPLLTHEERMAIIEHLKVRDDDAEARPAGYDAPAACPVARPAAGRVTRR